jgi:cytochrome oxidase assembly protein ShyY1
MTQINTRRDRLFTVLAISLLLALVIVCGLLGRWQLSRAEQRRAVSLEINNGRQQSPMELSAATPTNELTKWRPVKVVGRWANEYSVLLDNRNLAGRPGLWLATPLVLRDGYAVLVLRGWLARPLASLGMAAASFAADASALKLDLTPTAQDFVVSGELQTHVPRLFELSRLSNTPAETLSSQWRGQPSGQISLDHMPRLQNLELDDLAKKTGLSFIPTVLLQTDKQADGLQREWPEPSQDADKNLGYAAQWFGFAGIALIAALIILVRALRRVRRLASDRG